MIPSLQEENMTQSVLDCLPSLVALGRAGDHGVLPAWRGPDATDFGVLWRNWGSVVGSWSTADIADLIKGFTYWERHYRRGFGSVPPVPDLFGIYASRVDAADRDQLADWVLSNTVNDYSPFGTHNNGARSLAELSAIRVASSARKAATARREQERQDAGRASKVRQATERLPRALLRKDALAVAALIAKGADVDVAGPDGRSARDIALKMGLQAWLVTHASRTE